MRQQLIKRQLRHQQWQNDQLMTTPSRKGEKSTHKKSFIHIEDAAEEESSYYPAEEPSKVEPIPITINEEGDVERNSPSENHQDDRHFLSNNHSTLSLSRYFRDPSTQKLTRLETK